MHKKRNNIKILLATVMALSLFSLNITAMKNEKNSTKQDVLNKSFEDRESKTNIFKKLNSNNTKLEKSSSVENMKSSLTLKEDEKENNAKNINKFNFDLKNLNPINLNNLNKLNILSKYFENKNERKKRDKKERHNKKILNKIDEIIQDTTKFNTTYKNLNKKILSKQQYEKLNNDLKLFSINISEIHDFIFHTLQNSADLENIIGDKIIPILDDMPLDLIAYNIENNNNNIDKNLLKLTNKNIKESIQLIQDVIRFCIISIKKNYSIHSIYSNYYKNPNETNRENLKIPLNEEQIDLCEEIDEIKKIKVDHIKKLKEINKKIKEIEILIKIKIYQKENANLFKKSKEELKKILKEMIENFNNQKTDLIKEYQKINNDFSSNEKKVSNLHSEKEK